MQDLVTPNSIATIYLDIHEELVLGKVVTLELEGFNYPSFRTSWYRFAKQAKLLVGTRKLADSQDLDAGTISIWLEKPKPKNIGYKIVSVTSVETSNTNKPTE